MQFLSCPVWFISLRVRFSAFIRVVVSARFAFFFMAEYSSLVCDLSVVTYRLMHTYSCFPILGVVNNTAVDVDVQTLCVDSDFVSLGYRPRNGNGGLYGGSILNFFRPPYYFP